MRTAISSTPVTAPGLCTVTVAAATVTVHKPGAVTGVEDIAVRITRRHDSAPSV